MTDEIKYQYFRDPKYPERVIAIGRILTKVGKHKAIRFAFAINRPTYWSKFIGPNTYLERKIFGDRFNKKTAHNIIEGRLKKKALTLQLKKGQHPKDAIIDFLLDDKTYWEENQIPSFVRRSIEHFVLQKAIKKTKDELDDEELRTDGPMAESNQIMWLG